MACCLIVAFLFAQFVEMLRRWGMYWGVVAVPDGAVVETVYTRIAAWFALPEVRRAIAVLIVIECGAIGSWVYYGHGAHLAGIARQGVSYAQLCSEAYRRAVGIEHPAIVRPTAG